MTTKEMIQAELENLSEEDMGELLRVIRELAQRKADSASRPKTSLMSKLMQIQFDGPPDFAANLDVYLYGEKNSGDSKDVR